MFYALLQLINIPLMLLTSMNNEADKCSKNIYRYKNKEITTDSSFIYSVFRSIYLRFELLSSA